MKIIIALGSWILFPGLWLKWLAKKSASQFHIEKLLFGPTKIVKNSDKSKYVYSSFGIAFDGSGSWSFGNAFARNVGIFCVDNSSLFHTDWLMILMAWLVQQKNFGINYCK